MPTNPKVSKRISEMKVEITKKGEGKGVTVSSYDVQVYATTGGFVTLSMTGDGNLRSCESGSRTCFARSQDNSLET